MNLTTETVDRVSALSQLKLSEQEREQMAAELEAIVTYMDVLNTLDTQGVEPLSHVFPVRNVTRPDTVCPSQGRAELLASAPVSDGETFLVPKAVP